VTALNGDSPNDSQIGVNVRVLPAVLQDGREVRTATSESPTQKDALDQILAPQLETLWTPDRRNKPQV
jgi:hypothetical protein